MTQSDPISRRPGRWTAFAVTAVTAASAVTIALPSTSALADPATPTPTTAAPAVPGRPAGHRGPTAAGGPQRAAAAAGGPERAAPAAGRPERAAPAAGRPERAAAAVDPNAPPAPPPLEPGRVPNTPGGFSYLLPAGWVVSDASRLNYGQALLSKQTAPAENGQPAPTANDTSVILGRLDLKLFAGAEQDNSKAAIRLASDMGEFFMPFPGVRINQQSGALQAGDMPGYFSSYEVKFTDTTKPNGQIWAGVVGTAVPNAPRDQRNQRWFVVWLGTAKDPIDPAAAKALAESIRPYAPPPPPEPTARRSERPARPGADRGWPRFRSAFPSRWRRRSPG